MGYVSVVRVAAYQSNTFDKKMYIPGVHPDKDSWTYTALFEINDKPCNNNSTDKYKSYNKPMCVILHNLKLNRNYQTKYVIMTLITDNTFYLFYKNKKSLMKFCYLHSSYDNNTRRQIEDRQMTRKSHNQRLSKLL